jgi:hypothetical protein
MVLVLQVVSSHLLGVAGIESALSAQACLAKRLLPHAANEAEALNRVNFPRTVSSRWLFHHFPLGALTGPLRARIPGRELENGASPGGPRSPGGLGVGSSGKRL